METELEASSSARDEVVLKSEDDEVKFLFSKPRSSKSNRLSRLRH